jgi:hypothetical protein
MEPLREEYTHWTSSHRTPDEGVHGPEPVSSPGQSGQPASNALTPALQARGAHEREQGRKGPTTSLGMGNRRPSPIVTNKKHIANASETIPSPGTDRRRSRRLSIRAIGGPSPQCDRTRSNSKKSVRGASTARARCAIRPASHVTAPPQPAVRFQKT